MLFKIYTWSMYSFLCKKTRFHTWALMKHLLLWQKTLSPPEKQQTVCNVEGEPLQTRYAGVQYFRVGPQLEPMLYCIRDSDSAVMIISAIYSETDELLLLSSKWVSLFGATWSRRLEQNNQFEAVENAYSVHNLVSNQMMAPFFSALWFFFFNEELARQNKD